MINLRKEHSLNVLSDKVRRAEYILGCLDADLGRIDKRLALANRRRGGDAAVNGGGVTVVDFGAIDWEAIAQRAVDERIKVIANAQAEIDTILPGWRVPTVDQIDDLLWKLNTFCLSTEPSIYALPMASLAQQLREIVISWLACEGD